jgi:WhiB family redox-sensing transcriptional regulator
VSAETQTDELMGLTPVVLVSVGDTDWKLDRACTPADADLFFPPKGGDSDSAKRICAGCSVRRECLTYALTAPVERFGIWGGLSGRERRALKAPPAPGEPLPPIRYFADVARMLIDRRRRPITHGTEAGYRAHGRSGTTPCSACREAHSVHVRSQPNYIARRSQVSA